MKEEKIEERLVLLLLLKEEESGQLNENANRNTGSDQYFREEKNTESSIGLLKSSE